MIRIAVLLLVVIFVGCKQKDETESVTETAKAEPATVENDLPNLQIRLVDGNMVDLKSLKEKTILVLFQPDCDHCQHEAEDIKANLDRFKNLTMYFVSSSPVDEIVKFSKDYKFIEHNNIHFGSTTTQNILDTFGAISAPSIYIYSEKGDLIQKFNGQTPVDQIIQYL